MQCGMDHPSIFISPFSLPLSPPATGIQFIAPSALSSPSFSTIHSSGMRPLHFFWLLWAQNFLRFRLYLFWGFQFFVFCMVGYKCYFYVYLFLLQNDMCIFPLSNCHLSAFFWFLNIGFSWSVVWLIVVCGLHYIRRNAGTCGPSVELFLEKRFLGFFKRHLLALTSLQIITRCYKTNRINLEAQFIQQWSAPVVLVLQSVKGLLTGWTTTIRFPAGTDLSLRHHIQTGSGDYPASFPNGRVGKSLPRGKVAWT